MENKKIGNCEVCERIALTKQGRNPYFVRELETGYVVIGDHQRFKGYTLLLCKNHAFRTDKLNYELLGAGNSVHMHWHFLPRRTEK